jgi:hypothetical protein
VGQMHVTSIIDHVNAYSGELRLNPGVKASRGMSPKKGHYDTCVYPEVARTR